jgi:mono/diheme cytochrome c family protein
MPSFLQFSNASRLLKIGVLSLTALGIGLAAVFQNAFAFPVGGNQTLLPVGTELNEDAIDLPREVFHSEASGGRKSYLVNLGDLAFNAPQILGGAARQAGISCGSCHVNGAANPKLFVPGMSTHPGNFDTSGPLFNPKANNFALDPVRIPSLRGARYLAPYGNDGRTASLREFIRNVIVGEFAGSEPSPTILDALTAYIQDIDFLPNPSLEPSGKLSSQTSEAERRGEVLFNRPFPHDPTVSCASCHIPSAAFVDHKQHDIGSGGLYKTAVGDGVRAYEREGAVARFKEISDFASVLSTAIPAHDSDVIDLATDTIGGELRELVDDIPDLRDNTVSGGEKQRNLSRMALKEVVLILRRMEIAADTGNYEDVAKEYRTYNRFMTAAVPTIVGQTEQWTLLNPAVHDAHYAALRQLLNEKVSR